MIDKLKKTVQKAGSDIKHKADQIADSAKAQATLLSDAAKEKTMQIAESAKGHADHIADFAKEKAFLLFEDWFHIFPDLEAYGLKVSSFGVCMSISPSLEIELRGKSKDFKPERVAEIIEAHKDSKPLLSIFKAIIMAYNLHAKVGAATFEIIYVKISIRLTPEIHVFLGEPRLV